MDPSSSGRTRHGHPVCELSDLEHLLQGMQLGIDCSLRWAIFICIMQRQTTKQPMTPPSRALPTALGAAIDERQAKVIDDIAVRFEVSRSEVLESLIRNYLSLMVDDLEIK